MMLLRSSFDAAAHPVLVVSLLMRKLLAPFLLCLPSAWAVEIRVATFNVGAKLAVGSTSLFDYGIGDPGIVDHESVKEVLARLDADVVALQEIHSDDLSGSPDDLDNMAAALGYPYRYLASKTNAFDTTLSVVILSRFPFLSTQSIGSPAGAKEITRLHPAVKVDVPGTTHDPLIIAAHLKAGTSAQEKFRRALEMKRLVGHLSTAGMTNDDNFVILGDFNPSSSNTTYTALPIDLPASFDLGADIVFPVSYSTNPLAYFTSPTAVKLDPRQLNGSKVTRPASGTTLDLFLVSPAIGGRPLFSEIYNSALDVSNSTGLPKAGDPLADNTSALASDHLAVIVDMELDSDYPNLDVALTNGVVSEGDPDGSTALTVRLPAIKATPVTLDLSSDDAAVVPVSNTLVIPAGSLTGSVAIRSPRDFINAGSRSVTFTATALGYDPDTAVLSVNDLDAPYAFTAPGQTITENFDGFSGNSNPSPWTISSGLAWQGLDSGSSRIAGPRAYGTLSQTAFGYIPDATTGTASVTITNESSVPLTSIRISLDAKQWRAETNGAMDRIVAEMVVGGQTIPLPGLTFTASSSLPAGIASGSATHLTAIATGIHVSLGGVLELKLSFQPGDDTAPLPTDVFINEFHYDNTSTDAGEFVEIVVSPGYAGNLSDLSLLTYNGSDGKRGSTHSLTTFIADSGSGPIHRIYHKYIPGLQNEIEGLALVSGTQVLQFISYEGAFTAFDGPAANMISTNIGVSQNTTEAAGLGALGLRGTGASVADFSWFKFSGSSHSPGMPNSLQSFVIPKLPHQGLAVDNITIAFLADFDLDGQPDELDEDDDDDGQSDAYETAFGSNPQNASSRFAPVFARSGTAPHAMTLTFPSAIGRSYVIQVSSDLSQWNDLSFHAGTGSSLVVALPSSGSQRFFRLRSGN
jgi:endonuclease/exonuclease/phosphatase family metal-dependent hydrolase